MKILSFGELIWDIHGDQYTIGGAPFNFSAHAAMCGAESYLLSAVGDDELGQRAVRLAAGFGVHTDLIAALPDFPTGRCTVSLDNAGKPHYTLHEQVAYDHIPLPPGIENEPFDLFSFGTLALREKDNRQTVKALLDRCRFAHVFCDVNIRPPFFGAESVALCLQNATILKMSDEDAITVAALLGAAYVDPSQMAHLLSAQFGQLQVVLITLGGDGSFALDCRTGEEYVCPAEPAQVVSTVGAGDSYSAAFVAALLSGQSVPNAMTRGARRSARVVASAAAVFDLPEDFQKE